MNYWEAFVGISQQPYFPHILNLINVSLIFGTVFVGYLSWKTSKRANELRMLPLLSIYFKGQAMKDRKIRIRNIGISPAYDIKIESFVTILTDIQNIWKLEMFISGTNVLIPDEEKELTLKATSNSNKADMDEFMVFHLDPEEEHQRKRVSLILSFRNAEGNYFYSKVETGAGGLFVGPSKKIGVSEKLYLEFRRLSEILLLMFYKFEWHFTKPYINQPKHNRGNN